MAYENRPVQSTTANALPTGTDPLVDNTSSGDVQAIKILDGTAGSTTPLAGQKARAISLSTTLSTEDIAVLTPPAAITGFSTAANQTTEIAALASILAKQSADPSSETTLAAILAKIIAAPATSAKQDALAALIGEVQASPTSNTLLERLKAIQTALAGSLAVTGTFWQATQPVSASALPLPSGASTESTLSTLNGKVPALGQALAAASVPVVLTASQLSTITPPAAISGFATQTTLASVDTKTPALGQALAAASTPVVLTAIQQAALTPPAAITGFSTAAKQPALGTAGSPSTDVITVQGIANGTAQPITAFNLTPAFVAGSSLNADLVAAFDASNYRSGSLQLTGTWVGTVQVQASMDAGTTWVALRIRKQDGTYSTSQTAVGIYEYGVPTGAQIRIRITAYSSGTVTGAAALTSMPFAPIAVEQTPTNLSATAVSGPTASGVADSGAPVKSATKYNATLPTFTDGNRADAQGDANGFLRVAAQPTNTIASTPTVSTSPAYTSGDSVGGKISLASAVRLAGTGGTIASVTITDKGKQSAATDVVFFNADPSNTTFTDNGALTVHDTDLLTIIGVVPITSWAAFVDNSVGYANGLGLGFKIASGTTLYACLVTRGTPTYTATTDIQLTICIIPD
jgi:hypothetical protein